MHKMIIESYKTEQHPAFPPTWTRLNPDPAKGAAGLAQELGDRGHLFVIFSPDEDDSIPVACSGLLPFRGENWIDEVVKPNSSDAEIANGALTESNTDWETCCFCIHPSARGRGLTYLLLDELVAFAKAKGAKRLISNYIAEETGSLWPKLGFEEIPGAGGMMPKGFRSDPEKVRTDGWRGPFKCLRHMLTLPPMCSLGGFEGCDTH